MVGTSAPQRWSWPTIGCENMILVFGKTGQVANELAAFESVMGLDRSQADLKNPGACMEAIYHLKPKGVINAAAFTAVDIAEQKREIAMQINADAPAAMAKACADLKIPFVHLSTDYVYEGNGQIAWRPSDLTIPQNIYGKSKLEGEKSIIKSGLIFAIVRTSWVVSAHGNNFIKTMLRLSQSHRIINVVSDQVGGPTPARDIARACVEIVKQLIDDPKKTGIYNYSGFPDVSWFEFAQEIFAQSGSQIITKPILTSEYPTQAERPLNSRLDCSVTKEVFKIMRPCWREGLKDILRDLETANEKT